MNFEINLRVCLNKHRRLKKNNNSDNSITKSKIQLRRRKLTQMTNAHKITKYLSMNGFSTNPWHDNCVFLALIYNPH